MTLLPRGYFVPLALEVTSVLSFRWHNGDMSEKERVTTEQVVVRRSPKFLTFMLLGIILGILAALILTFAFPNTSEFTLTQIFGFLVLITGSVGGTLGLIFALLVDRYYSRHVIEATAERIEVSD
jgi:NADH:ubiquinone oxidoreductase subunit K